MTQRDWRSPAAYSELDTAPPRDFAWEYLRRNPDYVEDFRNSASDADAADTARRWGLRFPGRLQSKRRRSGGSMATGTRSWHRHAVRIAAGLAIATIATLVGCCVTADVQ